MARSILAILGACGLVTALSASPAESPDSPELKSEPGRFRSPDDGAFDVSGFLDEKYGFLPLVLPITEPAVGYGAAAGVAFLSKPIGAAKTAYDRPNITFVGGLGTANGTWGTAAADLRYWHDGRIQTLVGALYASVNLDYYGSGEDAILDENPLRYNLEPKGGTLQAKVRLGDSRFWGGLSYAYSSTEVSFDAPAGAPGLPDTVEDSDVGGLTPSLTFDSRDNMFTPLHGLYVEGTVGLFDEALGADEGFQRARVIGMQFFTLPHHPIYLGYRGEAAASFGDAPFYLQPYVNLRGAPILRYQGEEAAQIEAECRWQFWRRYSLVGFAGYGAAWNGFERMDDSETVLTGGTGFRYEIARRYGIHMGLDVAFSSEDMAVYFQVGSAWARP